MSLAAALIAGFGTLTSIGLYLMDFEMHPKRSLVGIFATMIGAVGLIVVATCAPARAHDAEHPELDDWYRSLNSGKGPCCDGSDFDNGTAAHLAEIDWETRDGRYRVRIEGEWVDVPPEAVIDLPNRDGRALVWFFHVDGHPRVRCFMPGAGT